MFRGGGGYDYYTVYNMPIWLRRFTFNLLKEYYDNAETGNTPNTDKPKVHKPPTYISKARK